MHRADDGSAYPNGVPAGTVLTTVSVQQERADRTITFSEHAFTHCTYSYSTAIHVSDRVHSPWGAVRKLHCARMVARRGNDNVDVRLGPE